MESVWELDCLITTGAPKSRAPSLSPEQQAYAADLISQLTQEDQRELALLLHHCQVAAYVRAVMDSLAQFPFLQEQKEIALVLETEESNLTKWKMVGRIDRQSEALHKLRCYWKKCTSRLNLEYAAAVQLLWAGNYASYFQRYGIFEIQLFLSGRRVRASERKSSDLLGFRELQFTEHSIFQLRWYPGSNETQNPEARRVLEVFGSAAIIFHTMCQGPHNYDIF